MKNLCKVIGILLIPTTIIFALIGRWQQSIAFTFIYLALALQDINIDHISKESK